MDSTFSAALCFSSAAYYPSSHRLLRLKGNSARCFRPTNASRRHAHRSFMLRATLETSVEDLSQSPSTGRGFPSFVPEAAKFIEDDAARAMLRRSQYTRLHTSLPQTEISTCHCVSKVTSNTATPALFLHGFDSNMLEFRYMLPILDEMQDIEAHFVDLLGWGLTEKPNCNGFSYAPHAKREHLRAYQEQVMGNRPMILVGASIGGAAALDFALEYPDKVRALVLVDAQAFTDKPASGVMQAFPALASLGADVLRSNWLRWIAVKLSYENDKFKCQDTIRIGGLHCMSEGWKEAAVNFIIGEGYCVSKRVKDISCPTLVLWGDKDRVLPKAHPERFLETIPGSELTIVENCGHSPHIEHPMFAASRIEAFCRERLGP